MCSCAGVLSLLRIRRIREVLHSATSAPRVALVSGVGYRG
jgi:hypothetical protein